MFIIFLQGVRAEVYNFDAETGEDDITWRDFKRGEVHLVGEISPCGEDAVLEFISFGYVMLPNTAWTHYQGVMLRYNPDFVSEN